MGRTKTVTDAELLAAARALFVEQGFGASTKEIARRAGVSEGVLFQRYGTKADLFFAAMVPPPADIRQLFERHRNDADTPGALGKIMTGLIDYFRSMVPVLLPLMTHPAFRFDDFARRHPNSGFLVLQRELTGFLAEKRNQGHTSGADSGAAALLLIATAHSIAIFERLGAHGGALPRSVVRQAVLCLWEGLKPRARARQAE